MSSDAQVAYLSQAAWLMEQTHYELVAKGYPEGAVSAGIERARGMAEFHTAYMSPTVRGPAFLEALRHELAKAEDWCRKVGTSLAQP